MKTLFLFFFVFFPVLSSSAPYSIKDCGIDLSLKKNGEIYVKEDIVFNFPVYGRDIIRRIPLVSRDVKGNITKLYVYDIEVFGQKYSIEKKKSSKLIKIKNESPGFIGDVKIRVQYKIYGAITDFRDFLNFSYSFRSNEYGGSFEKVTFFIFLPDNLVINEEDIFLLSDNKESRKDLFSVYSDKGYIYGKSEKVITDNEPINIYLNLPNPLVKLEKITNFRLYLKEKEVYLIPFMVFIISFVIWWFFGKNETISRIVHYKPPKELNPAIAGYLFNDRADNRDLISLLFYWAKEGFITIEEVEDPLSVIFKSKDYLLKMEKILPLDAKPFEWIIFNGLFPYNVKVIRLSSLKNNFYQIMEQARKELENYIHSMDFYHKSSKKLGKLFRYISILGVFGGIWFFILKQEDIGFSLFISALILFLFSFIMPKKSSYGQSVYEIILGFRDFLEKVERPRIEKMLSKNPEYFNEVLPYAVALGVADKISKKFDGLFSKPPEWYSTIQRDKTIFNFPIYVDLVLDDFFKLFMVLSKTK